MEITEIHFESIDSTNAYARREYAFFAPEKITIISADFQTAGHGRYARQWLSPKNTNLLLTFCFRLPSNTSHLGTLTMIGAHAVAKILETKGLHPKIKWPNDIQLNGKKISGTLCEIVFNIPWAQIFLGIGINVNIEKEELKKIDQPATSLKNETGKIWDRDALKTELMEQIKMDLEQFIQQGFAPFHSFIEHRLAYQKERVSCFDGETRWTGICHSLGEDGRLNLLMDDGKIHALYSGDIHLSDRNKFYQN